MNGLSIVYIVDTVYPYYDGGHERRFFELARRLVMRGCKVTIFTSIPKNTCHNGIDFVNVYYRKNFFTDYGYRSVSGGIRFSIKLFEKIIKYGELIKSSDIIEVNQSSLFHIFPVKILREAVGGEWKLVMTVHEHLTEYFNDYWRNRLPSFKLHGVLGLITKSLYLNALKCADFYIVPSKPVFKSLTQHKVAKEKIQYIPNGIDVKLYSKYRSRQASKNKLTISFLGRLVPEKRIEWIIIALKSILKHNPNLLSLLEVNIIGRGPSTPILNNLIRRYSLNGIVKLRGYVPDHEKLNLLAESDIFCLPSRREGFSLALLEAMFLGAAPIVTIDPERIGINGVLELVSHLRNGYVTHSFNQFRNGLYRLIVDDDLRSMLQRNAMKTAEHYDWDNITLTAENIYRKISNTS